MIPTLRPPPILEADRAIAGAEIYGSGAMARIVLALPPIERVYSLVRFAILRPMLLSVMDLRLPAEGRILDVGCGFGLFAAYFGQTHRGRRIVGIDPNARRIGIARRVAQQLGLHDHRFTVGDVRSAPLEGSFDAVYVMDVMHHLPRADQRAVLERLRDLLSPGGTLIIKDITTESRFGHAFTEVLDRLMVGWNEPLAYRHHRDWARLLTELGFRVRVLRVPDVLPYPHIVIAATRE